MKIAVISLRRTPERWNEFQHRNRNSLKHCEINRIDGIDGADLLKSNIKTRLIAPSAHHEWSAGAIGIGLSHRLCWRICCNNNSPLVVLEDDVVLAEDWQLKLEQLLNPDTGIALLGWNLDSMLRSQFCNHQEVISLFEPAYPSEDELQAIVNSEETRKLKKLIYTFGLPGYWINPVMARILLDKIEHLESLPLSLGRGFPEIKTRGIDAQLNTISKYWRPNSNSALSSCS